MLHANGTAVDVQIQRDASNHESIYAFAVCVCSFARASNGGHNTQARDVRWGDWSGFGIACKHARGDGTSRRNPNEISHDLSPPWHPATLPATKRKVVSCHSACHPACHPACQSAFPRLPGDSQGRGWRRRRRPQGAGSQVLTFQLRQSSPDRNAVFCAPLSKRRSQRGGSFPGSPGTPRGGGGGAEGARRAPGPRFQLFS